MVQWDKLAIAVATAALAAASAFFAETVVKMQSK